MYIIIHNTDSQYRILASTLLEVSTLPSPNNRLEDCAINCENNESLVVIEMNIFIMLETKP